MADSPGSAQAPAGAIRDPSQSGAGSAAQDPLGRPAIAAPGERPVSVGAGEPGGGEGREGVDRARELAGQAAGQARERVSEASGRAGATLTEQLERRTTQAGERVGETAGDLRTVSQALREQRRDAPARYAEEAAERAERLASYLRESDRERILCDLEELGRRSPLAVILAGATLGFAASRLLKASSARRYEQALQSRAGEREIDPAATRSSDVQSAAPPGQADTGATPDNPSDPPVPASDGDPLSGPDPRDSLARARGGGAGGHGGV